MGASFVRVEHPPCAVGRSGGKRTGRNPQRYLCVVCLHTDGATVNRLFLRFVHAQGLSLFLSILLWTISIGVFFSVSSLHPPSPARLPNLPNRKPCRTASRGARARSSRRRRYRKAPARRRSSRPKLLPPQRTRRRIWSGRRPRMRRVSRRTNPHRC
ncbi:hypothetical protein L596_017586 [Steinernema carpocapsae]|uniref:Uncharacterized protein n=1 Tax=Steinernema carpocapsae TaxID=34508 RepID=A0A4U5N2U2_STECR|nr:hypothetical protein L596_017586 [Steinernema carpocapsae]